MAVSDALQKKWDSEKRPGKPSAEVLASLDAMGLFAPFRKQVEMLLATVDKKDALHPDVQNAIISWNQKIMGVPQLQEATYEIAGLRNRRADDYD